MIIKVINKQQIEDICKAQGSGRYTMDWLYSTATHVDKLVFKKTEAEKIQLRLLKHSHH